MPVIKVPFSYGTIATPLSRPDGDSTHTWIAFVKFPESVLETRFVKRVTFKLHESFVEPLRGILLITYN